MSPISLFWLLYIFYLASTLWDFYLSWRQYNVCRATRTRPAVVNEVISEEEFQKARNYKLDKMRFGFFSFAFDKAVMMAVIFCDILPWIWELCGHLAISIWPGSGEIFQSIIFIFFSTIFERVTSLPFSYYDTFYIEQKHGFNKETVPFFFKDRVKKLVVEMAISVPIVAAIIWIVLHSGLAHFHVVIWAFISLIIFVMMFVYPEFIAPLFDKYTPLPTSELKTKIEQLASKVSFPLTKIYVVEGSKRSSHSNAYMYGFWKNKRIVIYDTLLSKEMNEQLKQMSEQQTKEKESKSNATKEEPNKEEEEKKSEPEEDSQPKSEGPKQLGMSDDEVVAVLGHELGHWKYLHSVCLLISTELNLLLMLAVFAHFYRNESLFAAFGFSSQPVIIGLVLVTQYILGPYNELLSVAMSFVSRRFEFAADNFAAGLGYARLLQTGLIKLGKDNLSFPVDDWLYSACNHSHPPTVERVEALKKYQ